MTSQFRFSVFLVKFKKKLNPEITAINLRVIKIDYFFTYLLKFSSFWNKNVVILNVAKFSIDVRLESIRI